MLEDMNYLGGSAKLCAGDVSKNDFKTTDC